MDCPSILGKKFQPRKAIKATFEPDSEVCQKLIMLNHPTNEGCEFPPLLCHMTW